MAKEVVHLVRSVREQNKEPKTGDEFAIYALSRDLQYLKLELARERERNHYKNLMLLDEADFLREAIEGREGVSVEEIKRRISRIIGAVHKFEDKI